MLTYACAFFALQLIQLPGEAQPNLWCMLVKFMLVRLYLLICGRKQNAQLTLIFVVIYDSRTKV